MKKKERVTNVGVGEETIIEKEGKKDACYHKVKSRYSVWPSAYASGALVKCRKKGAKNWGNSKKNEEVTNEGAALDQEVREKLRRRTQRKRTKVLRKRKSWI